MSIPLSKVECFGCKTTYMAFNGTMYGHILSNDTTFIEYEIVEK
jgi:hypothetical protein